MCLYTGGLFLCALIYFVLYVCFLFICFSFMCVCCEYLVTSCGLYLSFVCECIYWVYNISISVCSLKWVCLWCLHECTPSVCLIFVRFVCTCLFIRVRRRYDTSRNCWSWRNSGYSRPWGRQRLCLRWRLNWPREWPPSPRRVLNHSSRRQQQEQMRESVHKIIFCQENTLWDGDET